MFIAELSIICGIYHIVFVLQSFCNGIRKPDGVFNY